MLGRHLSVNLRGSTSTPARWAPWAVAFAAAACGGGGSGSSGGGGPAPGRTSDVASCATGQRACGDRCVPAIAPTLAEVHSRVIAVSCAFDGCHDASVAPARGMDFTTPARFAASTIGVPSQEMPDLLRIKRGDPEGSYLYRKLLGRDISGDVMPPGQPLCGARVEAIAAWIRAGAAGVEP